MNKGKEYILQELKSRMDRLERLNEEMRKMSSEVMELTEIVEALQMTVDTLYSDDSHQEQLDMPNVDTDTAVFIYDSAAHLGEATESPDIKKMGFRDAMRHILGNGKTGKRPRDIKKVMLDLKYPYTATTELGLRISNELNRMKKANMVKKTASGLYKLAQNEWRRIYEKIEAPVIRQTRVTVSPITGAK